jgi:hypothetical protein
MQFRIRPMYSIGPINAFLSWKAFMPLSRLTFCAYLIHPVIIITYFRCQPRPFHFGTHSQLASDNHENEQNTACLVTDYTFYRLHRCVVHNIVFCIVDGRNARRSTTGDAQVKGIPATATKQRGQTGRQCAVDRQRQSG